VIVKSLHDSNAVVNHNCQFDQPLSQSFYCISRGHNLRSGTNI